MPVLRIPTPLRSYTNGQSEVNINGSNISDALTDLTTQYPSIRPHLFNDGGELRPFVNLFIGENNIKDLQGVDTPIKDGDRLVLIPSIAGGCRCERTLRSNLPTQGDFFGQASTALAMTFSAGGQDAA